MGQFKSDLVIGDQVEAREFKQSQPFSTVLGAGFVVTADMPSVLLFDANGAGRNIDMPAPSADIEGKRWTIINQTAATHALTVRNNGGATIQSIPATKAAEIMVINVAGTLTWKVLNVLA